MKLLALSVLLVACGPTPYPTTRASLLPYDRPLQYADETSLQAAIEADELPFAEDASDPSPDTAEAIDEAVALDEGEAADQPAADGAAELTPVEQQRGAFLVRMEWGNPRPNPAGKDTPVDYSGTVTVDAADGLRRVRAWRFEKQDGTTRPNAYTIALASTIYTHSDGLHALVLTQDGATTLTITLGAQLTKTYALDASTLKVRELIDAQAPGQKVRIAIDRVRPKRACGGRIVGRWLNKGKLSLLVGRVLSEEGKVIGLAGGFAGERKNGTRVVLMKIVSKDHDVAFVKGGFDPASKSFSGKVLGPGGKKLGAIDGEYERDTTVGHFEGEISCD